MTHNCTMILLLVDALNEWTRSEVKSFSSLIENSETSDKGLLTSAKPARKRQEKMSSVQEAPAYVYSQSAGDSDRAV